MLSNIWVGLRLAIDSVARFWSPGSAARRFPAGTATINENGLVKTDLSPFQSGSIGLQARSPSTPRKSTLLKCSIRPSIFLWDELADERSTSQTSPVAPRTSLKSRSIKLQFLNLLVAAASDPPLIVSTICVRRT